MNSVTSTLTFALYLSFTTYSPQKAYPIDMKNLTENLYAHYPGTNKKPFQEMLYIYNPDKLVLVNYTNLSDKGVVVTTHKDYFTQKEHLSKINEGYYLLSLHLLTIKNNNLALNITGAKYDGTVLNDSIGHVGIMDGNQDVLLSVKKDKFVYVKMTKQYY